MSAAVPDLRVGAWATTTIATDLQSMRARTKDFWANCRWGQLGVVVEIGRDGSLLVRHLDGQIAAYDLCELEPTQVREGVRALIHRWSEVGTQYLLLERSDSDPYRPGACEPAGGAREPGESLLEAGSREIREETDLSVRELKLLNRTYQRQLPEDGGKYAGWTVVEHLMFGYVRTNARVHLSDEHVSFHWWTAAEVRQHWSSLTDSGRWALPELFKYWAG